MNQISDHNLDELDALMQDYLRSCDGDALAALRLALTDALRDAVDSRLRILELERAASVGYLRRHLDLYANAGELSRAMVR